MGYSTPVDGRFDEKTEFAVSRFQRHFFSGSRRDLIPSGERGKVGKITAEFIKRMRP